MVSLLRWARILVNMFSLGFCLMVSLLVLSLYHRFLYNFLSVGVIREVFMSIRVVWVSIIFRLLGYVGGVIVFSWK